MTAKDVISRALRLIGVIASGETPTANEQADALLALNSILEGWSAEGLMIFNNSREVFALTPAKQDYTIGVGGDFDTARPAQIIEACVEVMGVNTSKSELPIEIITMSEWSGIPIKDTQSTIPQRLYTDGNFPLLGLHLWPIPSVANNLVLYTLKPITSFALATDDVNMPPGYAKALTYNLAMELAPEFGKEASQTIVSTAIESKAALARVNTDPVYMESDAIGLANRKSFNWLTGR